MWLVWAERERRLQEKAVHALITSRWHEPLEGGHQLRELARKELEIGRRSLSETAIEFRVLQAIEARAQESAPRELVTGEDIRAAM